MSRSTEAHEIMTGDAVYGADGEKVGTVSEVQRDYIVVEKGLFFPTDYYIPRSAIATASGGQVYLSVSKDAALHSGWDTLPEDVGTTVVETDALTDTGAAVRTSVDTRATGDEEIRVPIMEEELTATVRAQEAGAVRIEKQVVAEERTLDVPLTEERVRVERRVVDRPVDAGDAAAFEEVIVDIPLRSETVDIQKQARVTGEVVVSKEAVQRTERVTDTVRREEVSVDESAVTNPRPDIT